MTEDSPSVEELTRSCEEETRRFRRQLDYDPHACFELFRLALAEGNNTAFASIYRVYLPLVYYWVNSHPYFPNINTPAEDCVSDAMQRLYFGLRDANFIQKAESLEGVLGYLKKCVHSTIMTVQRRQEKQGTLAELSPDAWQNIEGDSYQIEQQVLAQDIWARVIVLLPDPNEQLLARLCFVLQLKPSEIVNEYASLWSTTEDVRIARQRIKRALWRDDVLKELYVQ
jgi:hypothetical protein